MAGLLFPFYASLSAFISKLIKPLEIKISRIALGIPVGSDIEYAAGLTISKALSGRSSL